MDIVIRQLGSIPGHISGITSFRQVHQNSWCRNSLRQLLGKGEGLQQAQSKALKGAGRATLLIFIN